MAEILIPHLNYNIRQALNRLAWQQSIYNQEFVERLKLVFGHPNYFTNPSYGIVAEEDPVASLAGQNFPLVVSASAGTNILTVDVNPGMAVTKSGVWVLLTDYVRQIDLADTSLGVPNVIYLAYALQGADLELNEFQEWVVPLESRLGDDPDLDNITGLDSPESDQVFVDTVDTYVGYPESVSENFIPLAVVTVQNVVDPTTSVVSTTLAIDHTRDVYSWNRPWFSAIDIEHRAKQGSGTQSDNNPHALGQSDLSDGDITIYQTLLNHGMVLGKDQSVAKVPGYRCQVAIPYDQLLTDDANGTYTGFPNRQYAKLANFPIRVGKAWLQSTSAELCALQVPGTNRIVFPSVAVASGDTVNVYYTRVEAGEPPAGDNEVTFTTNNPRDGELIIGGGLGHKVLASTQENFSNEQKFPMRYEIFVDRDGSIRKTPQVIYCFKRLDTIGTQDDITIDQYGPGHVMMGLADASGAGSMSVKIRLYGTDANGTNIDYLFEFVGGTYSSFTIPSTTIPTAALKVSSQSFSTIENFVIEERIDDGPNSAVVLWVMNTPFDTYDKMKDACHLCDTMWDGLRMAEVYDKRIVETTVRDFLVNRDAPDVFRYLVNTLAGGKQSIYVEDFRRPIYHTLDLAKDYYSNDVLKYFPHINFNKLQMGLEGVYRTKPLPAFDLSGFYWRVILVPQRYESGTNPFVTTPPRMRYRNRFTGLWESWVTMSATTINHTYDYTIPIPMSEVQFEVDPYPHAGMIMFG